MLDQSPCLTDITITLRSIASANVYKTELLKSQLVVSFISGNWMSKFKEKHSHSEKRLSLSALDVILL